MWKRIRKKRKTIPFLLKGPIKHEYIPVKKSKLLQKSILGIKLVYFKYQEQNLPGV
jgi:hypothetical protein